jgi:hypothetical protein
VGVPVHHEILLAILFVQSDLPLSPGRLIAGRNALPDSVKHEIHDSFEPDWKIRPRQHPLCLI